MKKFTHIILAGVLALIALAPTQTKAQSWAADGVHSSVIYTVKHMVTPMIGVFKKFNIEVTFDAANPTATQINATVDPASVVMGMDKLEGHLKSGDFFDVANHPEWSFKSTSVTVDKKSKPKGMCYIANGKLSVRGVTKDVSIPFQFLGTKESPYGMKAGFSTEFTINRLDYGVGQGDWAGTGVVANEVKITVFLEMNGKK